MIWTVHSTPDDLNQRCRNSLCDHLGIVFTEVGKDHLTAEMPVDRRTHQPMGILHGGASCALAETVGSVAANLCIQPHEVAVGLDLNINHIRQIEKGVVIAVAKPIHIGKTTQVWEIRITNSEGKIIAISRLTVAVITKK